MKLVTMNLFSCTSRNAFFGTPPTPILLRTVLVALASLFCGASSMIAQTLSISTNVICLGNSVTVTVTPGDCEAGNAYAYVCDDQVPLEAAAGVWTGSYTPSSAGTFTVTASDDCDEDYNDITLTVVQLVSISVGGATEIDTSDYATVETSTANYVTITATLTPDSTSAATLLNWSGGSVVSTNPLEDQVSTTSSLETPVTASVCTQNKSVNIWILWSAINIFVANPKPSGAPSFGVLGLTDGLGVYLYGGGTSANGQMCAVATLTPTNVHSLITSGWSFVQKRMSHDFNDGAEDTTSYDSTWQPDGPSIFLEHLTPDANDDIYMIDPPNIAIFHSTSSSEVNGNFYDYVTWGGQICSSTNNFWHFAGRWLSTATPQVTSTDLNTGTITLPTTPFY